MITNGNFSSTSFTRYVSNAICVFLIQVRISLRLAFFSELQISIASFRRDSKQETGSGCCFLSPILIRICTASSESSLPRRRAESAANLETTHYNSWLTLTSETHSKFWRAISFWGNSRSSSFLCVRGLYVAVSKAWLDSPDTRRVCNLWRWMLASSGGSTSETYELLI